MMILEVIDRLFSVCRIPRDCPVSLSSEFCFVGKTDEELSLVCEAGKEPETCLELDSGWKAFRIQGVLDFSMVGVLSRISGILAEQRIGIFAVSTYNTDYILVKKENLRLALEALERHGYQIH